MQQLSQNHPTSLSNVSQESSETTSIRKMLPNSIAEENESAVLLKETINSNQEKAALQIEKEQYKGQEKDETNKENDEKRKQREQKEREKEKRRREKEQKEREREEKRKEKEQKEREKEEKKKEKEKEKEEKRKEKERENEEKKRQREQKEKEKEERKKEKELKEREKEEKKKEKEKEKEERKKEKEQKEREKEEKKKEKEKEKEERKKEKEKDFEAKRLLQEKQSNILLSFIKKDDSIAPGMLKQKCKSNLFAIDKFELQKGQKLALPNPLTEKDVENVDVQHKLLLDALELESRGEDNQLILNQMKLLKVESTFNSEKFLELMHAKEKQELPADFKNTFSDNLLKKFEARKGFSKQSEITLFKALKKRKKLQKTFKGVSMEPFVLNMSKIKYFSSYDSKKPVFYGIFPQTFTIKGNEPLKENENIDYSIDSEAEWEDVEGEDLFNDDILSSDDADKDKDQSEIDDGFIVADGYLSNDEGIEKDEEHESDKEVPSKETNAPRIVENNLSDDEREQFSNMRIVKLSGIIIKTNFSPACSVSLDDSSSIESAKIIREMKEKKKFEEKQRKLKEKEEHRLKKQLEKENKRLEKQKEIQAKRLEKQKQKRLAISADKEPPRKKMKIDTEHINVIDNFLSTHQRLNPYDSVLQKAINQAESKRQSASCSLSSLQYASLVSNKPLHPSSIHQLQQHPHITYARPNLQTVQSSLNQVRSQLPLSKYFAQQQPQLLQRPLQQQQQQPANLSNLPFQFMQPRQGGLSFQQTQATSLPNSTFSFGLPSHFNNTKPNPKFR